MLPTFLVVASGVCWTVVYVELIRLGFRDKTCGMPLFALGLNIAWEVLYSVDGLFVNQAFVPAQTAANVAWACCDVAILVAWFKFGRRVAPGSLGEGRGFVPISLAALASCVAMQLAFHLHFPDVVAASQYSAFAQNAAMSAMFVWMFFERPDTRGQSMTIAVCKCVGTLAPTILGGIVEGPNAYILLMGAVCLALVIIYIALLARRA